MVLVIIYNSYVLYLYVGNNINLRPWSSSVGVAFFVVVNLVCLFVRDGSIHCPTLSLDDSVFYNMLWYL